VRYGKLLAIQQGTMGVRKVFSTSEIWKLLFTDTHEKHLKKKSFWKNWQGFIAANG
jgi:hypothetical protein